MRVRGSFPACQQDLQTAAGDRLCPGAAPIREDKNGKSRVSVHNNGSLFQMPVRLWASFFLQTALLRSSKEGRKVLDRRHRRILLLSLWNDHLYQRYVQCDLGSSVVYRADAGSVQRKSRTQACVGGNLLPADHLIKFSHPGSVGSSIFFFRCHTFCKHILSSVRCIPAHPLLVCAV